MKLEKGTLVFAVEVKKSDSKTGEPPNTNLEFRAGCQVVVVQADERIGLESPEYYPGGEYDYQRRDYPYPFKHYAAVKIERHLYSSDNEVMSRLACEPQFHLYRVDLPVAVEAAKLAGKIEVKLAAMREEDGAPKSPGQAAARFWRASGVKVCLLKRSYTDYGEEGLLREWELIGKPSELIEKVDEQAREWSYHAARVAKQRQEWQEAEKARKEAEENGDVASATNPVSALS